MTGDGLPSSPPLPLRPSDNEYLTHELLSLRLVTVSGTIIDLLARAHELYQAIGARRMMSQVGGWVGCTRHCRA